MSASAPDGSASTSMGSIAATCTIATSASAPGSSTSSHCAPTVCIQMPIRLATCASHNARNALMRNGAHADCFIGPRDCVVSAIRPPYRGAHPGRPRMGSSELGVGSRAEVAARLRDDTATDVATATRGTPWLCVGRSRSARARVSGHRDREARDGAASYVNTVVNRSLSSRAW